MLAVNHRLVSPFYAKKHRTSFSRLASLFILKLSFVLGHPTSLCCSARPCKRDQTAAEGQLECSPGRISTEQSSKKNWIINLVLFFFRKKHRFLYIAVDGKFLGGSSFTFRDKTSNTFFGIKIKLPIERWHGELMTSKMGISDTSTLC